MARVWTRESASLDHRPKQITVNEIMLEQKDDTAEHFRVSNIISVITTTNFLEIIT